MSRRAAGSIAARARKGETSYHLTLLAPNRTGFRKPDAAFQQGVSGGLLSQAADRSRAAGRASAKGIICLSGCVSGELSRTLLSGNTADEALARGEELAAWFHRVFGDRYFIEIQNNGLEMQRQALELSVDLAKRMGLPLVATSDAHYVRREDAVAQDVLLCINTGKFRTDTNRMRMEGDQFYLRSPEEMYAAFPGLEDAVARSQQIADSVDLQLELGQAALSRRSRRRTRRRRASICASCAKPVCASGMRTIRAAGRTTIRNRAS